MKGKWKITAADTSIWIILYISGKSALKTTLPKLPKAPTLLVHNTYTSIDDVQWAESQKNNLYWCTCPNANLYIEGVLPNYNIFQYSKKMTIGTDSLASNYTLSIWDEVQTIRKYTRFAYFVDFAKIQILLIWEPLKR